MGVIIDDFEVVVEAPPPVGGAAAPTPERPKEAPGLSPDDVRHVVATREGRAARLFAH
jgi:hypothetical protein